MSRPNGVDCSRQFEGLMAQFERKAVSCDDFAILKNQSHVELGQTKRQTNKIILIWNQEHKVKPPNGGGKNTFKFEHKTHHQQELREACFNTVLVSVITIFTSEG